MRVVHINIGDTNGGAAIAAFRHCEAMRKAGIDASMLVYEKSKASDLVYQCDDNKKIKIKLKLNSLLKQKVFNPLFQPWEIFSYPYSFLSASISKHPLVKNADIIYIHWIGNSMLSTKAIESILKLGKPVRWYMHDMNPITGGCHYAMECKGYKSDCSNCPFIKQPLGIDIAAMQYKNRMKRWASYLNLEAYTPSVWLGNCVQNSKLWKGHKVTIFPNVIDTEKFHPVNKTETRNLLNLPKNKKLILFGAANITSKYKGWEYLCEAINQLDPERYEAIIFGPKTNTIQNDIKIPCHFLGYLKDEYSLIAVYNAVNVFVSSSIAENYPNVIIEAMSCGLPCVAFKTGGIPDQITHKVNGYLAEIKDSKELSNGIEYICELPVEAYNDMQLQARAFVESNASYDIYKHYNLE